MDIVDRFLFPIGLDRRIVSHISRMSLFACNMKEIQQEKIMWNQAKFRLCSVHLALLECPVLKDMHRYKQTLSETELDGVMENTVRTYDDTTWDFHGNLCSIPLLERCKVRYSGKLRKQLVVVQSGQFSSMHLAFCLGDLLVWQRNVVSFLLFRCYFQDKGSNPIEKVNGFLKNRL